MFSSCVLVTSIPTYKEKRELIRWLPSKFGTFFWTPISISTKLIFWALDKESSCLCFHQYIFVMMLFKTQVIMIIHLITGVFFDRFIYWFWCSTVTTIYHYLTIIWGFIYLCHSLIVIFLIVYLSIFGASLKCWRYIILFFSICRRCVYLFSKRRLVFSWH